jgi:hypothetical protein
MDAIALDGRPHGFFTEREWTFVGWGGPCSALHFGRLDCYFFSQQ